ncbi:MAG: valine--tRNA ligase [Phycisphaerales bacterium]
MSSTTTRSKLAKSYDPAAEEPRVREKWSEVKPFHPDPTAPGPTYAIVIPPPNVTAALHLGHALNNTLQDVLIRFHRSRGFNTLWMPGTDHAGIATQTVVEKRVLEEEGRRRTDFEREEFVERIQAWKDEYEATIIHQLELMGCSCDWDRTRFTMDPVCARAVREAFFRLFRDGLIYRGKRLVNWDPATQTALADDEVEMEVVDGYFWYLKYPIVDDSGVETGEHVTVATTRPETMLGDTAVAVNPADPERAAFIGRQVRLPIVNRIVPVIGDEYVVVPDPGSDDPKAKYASGFLKVTPAHDPNDWDIGQRHNLDAINVMAPDGRISDKHGWDDLGDGSFLVGMDRYEAREAVVTWFRERDLLAEVKPYQHSIGHSYRSHVAIEPYLSDQWYVKVTDERLAGAALRAMSPDQRSSSDGVVWSGADAFVSRGAGWEGGLRFAPTRYARTFQSWHENIRDWCISRQLWWGHRIPVWSATVDDENVRRLVHDLVVDMDQDHERLALRIRPREEGGFVVYLCPRTESDEELIEGIETRAPAVRFERDPDVLDTWFSSALWPMSTMGWPEPEAFPEQFPEGSALIESFNPTTVLSTAREIITLWVSRMVMFNTYFLDRLPFRDVFIHAMIQDGEGRKMSKSLGNGVDPRDIIKSKGSDAMRFTLVQMTTQTQDVRMPVEYDAAIGANTSPKFEIGRRLCNKLWNATRFALSTLGAVEDETPIGAGPVRLVDRWMVSRLGSALRQIDAAMTEYQFNVYAQTMYDLFWRDFCDWYLEAVKPTVRDDRTQAAVLRGTLAALHRMFHPIIPFVTETLHEAIESLPVEPIDGISTPPSELAANAAWPRVEDRLIDPEAEAEFERARELISAIRELRAAHEVHQKRRVTLHVGDESTRDLIARCEGVVESLAGLEQVVREAATGESVKFVVSGVEHAISNLVDSVDTDAERDRLSKRRDELAGQVERLESRLANPSYVNKAPAHLVDETRASLAEAETELAGIREALARL